MAYDTVAQAGPETTTSPNEVAIFMRMGTGHTYTVPTGKIFKGHIHSASASSNVYFYYTPSAATLVLNPKQGDDGAYLQDYFYHTSTGFENKWPVYLNAGDILRADSSEDWFLIGLETTVNTVSWDTSG